MEAGNGSARRWAIRAGLVAAGLVAGAVLAGALSAGAATLGGTTTSGSAGTAEGQYGGPGVPGSGGAQGQGGHGGADLNLTGTVTATGTGTVTIKTSSGTMTTYKVDSSSDIDKNGEAQLSSLVAGDAVRYSVRSDTTTIAILHAGDEAKDMPTGPRTGGNGAYGGTAGRYGDTGSGA